ncbi:LysR family transcriptional regulator [Pseudoclavibacter chungangensis]|uniref:LysR family transcriptional regulator n=1 Tax=Pseudoclavibacter chungangensis TaxID=587635 RepID=A0A7J5BQ94_9MICO|nr:LysR family transcriptional regulator [Pseudoclavibacter chungangensis]KAB1653426.1 LysR family transcriptional regulator [Pseudoclavibacter chungangensis]KAB1657210.1 LysR family transcriptional regulator [Pseudoclavibacter chungangensis]
MSRPVSWDALRVFLAVHRAGSFSAAADELGSAQSSVSEQIARLERNLGYVLVARDRTGVRTTDRGLELAARVSGPVDALAAATSLNAALRTSGGGHGVRPPAARSMRSR